MGNKNLLKLIEKQLTRIEGDTCSSLPICGGVFLEAPALKDVYPTKDAR